MPVGTSFEHVDGGAWRKQKAELGQTALGHDAAISSCDK